MANDKAHRIQKPEARIQNIESEKINDKSPDYAKASSGGPACANALAGKSMTRPTGTP
jgi:hypothetical protein